MSENKDTELLIELAKLLKKFGTGSFDTLAENLSKPEFSERLVLVLTSISKASKSLPQKPKRKSSSRDFRSSLVESAQSEPGKFELLIKLYDDLGAKTILPSLRDIKFFVEDVGLNPMKATDRSKAVIALIKQLSLLNADEIRSKVSNLKFNNFKDDRSLEGWNNIIFNKNRRDEKEGDF